MLIEILSIHVLTRSELVQESNVDPSQYASSQIVATSKPRELGSVGPDSSSNLAGKLGDRAKIARYATANGNGSAH